MRGAWTGEAVGAVGAALVVFLIVEQEFQFGQGLSSRDFTVAMIVAAGMAVAGPAVSAFNRRGAGAAADAAAEAAAAANRLDELKSARGRIDVDQAPARPDSGRPS